VKTLKPQIIIEIGTYQGLSALSMKKFLKRKAKIYTFDLIKWNNIENTCLLEEDFKDNRLIKLISDLSNYDELKKHEDLLTNADLIFIDAEKDGIMEQNFINNFSKLKFKSNPLFIFDDIRLWNMISIWHNIKMPKLDLTSFGHFSGTGLVLWETAP